MYYCEKCRSLSGEEICPNCSVKDFREAREDDFCLLVECEEIFGKMLETSLQNEEIPFAVEPFGNGVRSQLGLSLGGHRIYVLYPFYQKACDMLEFFANQDDPTDGLKERILNHMDKWTFESKSTEKKIRKKHKLGKDVDVMRYVKECVEQAQSIEDVGLMSYGEHGLLVKNRDVTLWFSGESYTISI